MPCPTCPERFGRPVADSLPTIIRFFKAAVTRAINELHSGFFPTVWQRNYYEHIIRSEKSLNHIRQYILDNPARWEFDRENTSATDPNPKTHGEQAYKRDHLSIFRAFHSSLFSFRPYEQLNYTRAKHPRRSGVKLFIGLLSIFLLQSPLARGQTSKPSSLAELAVYSGADREQLLAAGAKKEGKVVWYTAIAGGSYKDLVRAFESKYGIPVEAYRGASRDLIAKVLAETQAKKYLMDVAESSPPLLMLMRAMKRLTPFNFAAPRESVE